MLNDYVKESKFGGQIAAMERIHWFMIVHYTPGRRFSDIIDSNDVVTSPTNHPVLLRYETGGHRHK